MYFISYFFLAFAEVLNILITLFMWIVFARAALSWVDPNPLNPIVQFIRNITNPVLNLVRSKLPCVYGGFDFSPILVFLCLIFLRTFIINSLTQMAQSLI